MPETRYSISRAQDKAYVDAVESGDYLTAKRLYDEVRIKAGYTVKVYHGTDADFTAFDTSTRGAAAKAYASHGWAAQYTPGAIFLATTRRMASGYGSRVMGLCLGALDFLMALLYY